MPSPYKRLWQEIDAWVENDKRAFIAVIYDNDKHMLDCLAKCPKNQDIHRIQKQESSQQTRQRLLALATSDTSSPAPEIVHLTDWYQALGREAKTYLQNLNTYREALLKHLPFSLVFWLHQEQFADFSRYAGDIWAWTRKIHLSRLSDEHTDTLTHTLTHTR